MDEIKKYDRVILMMDFKVGDTIIPEGTIGTYRSLINDNTIVQIGYINDNVRLVSLPDTLLRKVDLEELQDINPESITPKMYHEGNAWSVPTGYHGLDPVYITGEIVGIKLATNEAYDKIKLRLYSDNTEKEYTKRFIENHASYMVLDIPKYVDNNKEEKHND